MKRRERRHLKEDEFVSTITKIVRFFRQYQREIKIVAVSLIAVILLLVLIRVIQVRGVNQANQQLATILKLSENLREKIASGEENPSELKELEKMAGTGRYGRLAYIHLANYWVAKNDLLRAQAFLEKFPAQPRDLFYYQAKDLLGEILIWRQEYDQAIKLYESLEKEKKIPYIRDSVLIHLAEAFEKKGDKKKALEIYRQLQSEFPYSAYIWNIADRIRRLGG
ncbi:MAG: tetratricopeptide repeat protein [Candidatus Aminicenantes bacterium]|nr:tetratricopeptide repeat protein [Candidatus Aminicenantes bacterium]